MRFIMVEEKLHNLMEKKEDYLKFKRKCIETPLKKSFDIIIDQINLDIVNILKHNKT